MRCVSKYVHGTPQASHISNLVAQLLDEQEVLVRHKLDDGTDSAVQNSIADLLVLFESNALTMQALMDSMEKLHLQ